MRWLCAFVCVQAHMCVNLCICGNFIGIYFSVLSKSRKRQASKQVSKQPCTHTHNILYIDCIIHMDTIVCSPSAFWIYMKLIFVLKDRHKTAPLWSHSTYTHIYINTNTITICLRLAWFVLHFIWKKKKNYWIAKYLVGDYFSFFISSMGKFSYLWSKWYIWFLYMLRQLTHWTTQSLGLNFLNNNKSQFQVEARVENLLP